MIRKRSYNSGLILDRSFRSYALNTALRLFVKPQFKSDIKPPAEMREFMQKYIESRAKFPPEPATGKIPWAASPATGSAQGRATHGVRSCTCTAAHS
jgi:hypothetical protein